MPQHAILRMFGSTAVLEETMWNCTHCGTTNWDSTPKCRSCAFDKAGAPPEPSKPGTFAGTPRDVFISHASADADRYIQPLSDALQERKVTFWLDALEIGWGDSIVLAMNEGLAAAKFVLLCLSERFLARRWPEAEMSAALATQMRTGVNRVLPLILEAPDKILARYPLLESLSYRDYSGGPWQVAEEIAALLNRPRAPDGKIRLVVESVHGSRVHAIAVDPRVSVQWLIDRFITLAGVSTSVSIGAYDNARFSWVLVDVSAESAWQGLGRDEQRRVKLIVAANDGVQIVHDATKRLNEIPIADGTVFHFYAVPAHDPPPPVYSIE